MNFISLPRHTDSSSKALLIDGPYYDGYATYVPCTLLDGRTLRLCIPSHEGMGILVRRQPVLTFSERNGLSVDIATMHVKRIQPTTNMREDSPHLFTDVNTEIDIRSDRQGILPVGRTGRIAYAYTPRIEGYSHRNVSRVLYISDQAVTHPELDALPDEILDEAYANLSSAEHNWSRVVSEHRTGRLRIELPGSDLYVKYVQNVPDKLPDIFAEYLKYSAGRSGGMNAVLEDPVRDRRLAACRSELITFIEMLSGLTSLLIDSVHVTYDGDVPTVHFSKGDVCLNLHVNELPTQGNFVVVDPSQQQFEKLFSIHETLAQAITSIITRMTYA